MKGWGLLLIAVVLEVLGTSMLNSSEGFRRLAPAIGALTAYSCSFVLFSRALQYIPLGIAYAVWAGVGIVIVCLIGALFFKNELPFSAYLGILLILVGAIIASLSGYGNGESS